jgi:hypothetical protein
VAARQKPPEKAAKKSERVPKDDVGRGGTPPDVKRFGPDKLEALLKRVESPKLGYIHRDESVVRWLKYWARKNKGLVALKSIDDYFNSHENPRAIEPLLDEAFDVSIEYEGRRKAYKWLVRAHIERRGWQSNWDNSGNVQRRLELAAKYYKNKWVDFIHDTSKPARYWEKRRFGFVIGMQWLVVYLLLVKQTECAIQLVESMVQLTSEEVHDQPIPSAGWLS